jgi:serine/threonine protein kinase
LRDLIAKMLNVDPKKRITLAEVRMHPWILKDCKGPPASYLPKLEPVTEIDDEIMKELVSLGFKDKASNRHAILKNKDKQVVSAYQLCLTRKKEIRSRSCSVSVSRQVTKSSLSPSSSLSKLRRASVSNPTGIPYIDSHTRRGQMGQGAASVADLKVRKHIRDPNKRKTYVKHVIHNRL